MEPSPTHPNLVHVRVGVSWATAASRMCLGKLVVQVGAGAQPLRTDKAHMVAVTYQAIHQEESPKAIRLEATYQEANLAELMARLGQATRMEQARLGASPGQMAGLEVTP